MIERMQKDFIASRIKSTEQETSTKSKNGILEIEAQKMRKTKEDKLQSQDYHRYHTIQDNIDLT